MSREGLCGLDWEDVDLDRGTVRIERTRTVASQPHDSDLPKTKKSRGTLSLGPVMSHLREELQTLQKENKLKAHGAYVDDGRVFANELGTAY